MSARRIYQDLVADKAFSGSYYGVRRLVARQEITTRLPFRRMEALPGEEAQIDFGKGAPVIDGNDQCRRPWMLRVIVSHSSKDYSEVVWQSTDNFITALEDAFYYFGGATRRLCQGGA